MMRTTPDLRQVAVDTVFELLADRRSRIVLDYLRERAGEPIERSSIVDHVVAVETERWDGDVPPEYPQYVAADLQHGCLARLENSGLVQYDRPAGTVRYRGHALIDSVLGLPAERWLPEPAVS